MNSHESSIDPNEATRLLKDILHVGKTPSAPSDAAMAANGSLEGAVGGYGDPSDGMASAGNLLESIFRSSKEQQPPDTQQQQHICLLDSEEDVSVDVCGTEVQVVVSRPREDASSSNRVKIKNIVDYSWELKYNFGKHICLHMSGTYLAYALKAPTTPEGVVRVLNLKTGERLLVRGLKGQIRDMAFARLATTVMLAIVDEFGTLCVYDIHENTSTLLMKVERPDDEESSEYRRVVWCPYVPDDGARGGNSAEEDNSKVLVATNHEEAEVWNVGHIVTEYGTDTLTVPQVRAGLQRIIEHTKPIIDAAFAPDGTALATAGADGQVRFFQVYMQDPDATPRCLHRWSPHNQKPVTCLFFLDNLKACNPDTQFWKYALTGTDSNTELKIWSCETWACLQTIRFIVSPGDMAPLPALKVEMDPTSRYLVLSDIHRKVMYVGQVQQDTKAELVTLALFPMVLPVLSFTVVEAVRCRFKPSTDTEHVNRLDAEPQESDAPDDDRSSEKLQEGTLVRLHWMTTKSIQACHIIYPTSAISAGLSSAASLSTLSQHSSVSGCTDHLSDISADADDDERAGKSERDCNTPSNKGKQDRDDESSFTAAKLLLKPSDFVSPSNSSTSLTPCTAAASTNTDPLPSTTPPGESTDASTPVPSELCTIPVAASLPSPGTTPSALDLSRKGVLEEAEAVAATAATSNGHSEEVCELSEPPQRKLSQRSTASSSSQEVADIMAPAERLANAVDSSDEDDDEEEEELEPGLEYDSAAEDLHPAAPEPSASDPSILAASTCESQEGRDDGAWPQPPDNAKKFATATTVCKHPAEDGSLQAGQESTARALGEVELVISQLAEETSTLTQTVSALSSEFHEHRAMLLKLEGGQSHRDGLLSSLMAETRANLASLVKLEAAIAQLSEMQRAGIDKQASIVAQSLAAMLGTHLEKSIANEFKNSVVPTVMKVIDTTRCEISRRLETTEAVIRDTIIKAIKSKMMADTVAQAISTSVQSHVQGTCREIMQNTLMPSLDRICQNLFLQLNETFQKGTREFLHQAQQHIDKHGEARAAEAMKNVESHVDRSLQIFLRDHKAALVPPDFRAPLDEAVTNSLHNLKAGLLQALAGQQEMLVNNLREEMHGALKETVAAAASEGIGARSKMNTPVPVADPHLVLQQITLLVRQGQYNMAFQQALSVADLAIVVSTCEMVSPTIVFGQHPCPLHQPVLLSLIQQLCADLATSTEIKLKYLEEAVLSLDKENAVTKEHMTVILTQLCQKLNKFLTGTPLHDMGRMAKRLLMVTQSSLAC
ncbi:enhancer of mRNA-decapping protein 4-like isoform X2 [Dermacentor silvarum]|uniref:enhancer of mRNA-decapping protein 4-like isoform X2 n=1 Tax=Dermacentor silvarum TaxID=543639 RepID=UPI00189AF95D|nr:enhancer of mRNA-decapping protein 4-like isoform X2 [Dermacentor silvarum]